MNTRITRSCRRWCIALAVHLPASVLLGTMLLVAEPVGAATHVVSSLADDGTPGTLRQVIQAAGGGDTITIAVTGTIVLASRLHIDKDLTVTGPGASNLAISGNNAVGVLLVSNGVVNGITVNISGITFTNGHAFSSDVPFLGYYGGGIANIGRLTLTNTTVSQNDSRYCGGGIYNGGTLSVVDSEVSGNSVSLDGGGGGGICNARDLRVISSTISNNSVSLQTGRWGGAIFTQGGTVAVVNSTLTGNTAAWGGAIFQSSTTMTISNSTLSGNSAAFGGGGILGYFSVVPVTVKNSILGDNAGANCQVSGYWAPLSAGYNLSDDASCAAFLVGVGDRNDVPAGLTPAGLQSNGGPTATVALLPSSPAVDAIPTNACKDAEGAPVAVDQRGLPRPQSVGCDIGAFELSAAEVALNTSGGADVTIAPAVNLPNGTTGSLALTFDSVTTAGNTSVSATATGPPPPAGFKLTSPPVYYEITTTATFSGSVRVCLGWAEGQLANENHAELFHYEGGHWVDITDPSSRNTTTNTVCGTTTSLSPFTLFEVTYAFSGLFPPVDNLPTVNSVKAGLAVPVRFSLGGDHGLDIFAADYPRVQQVQCTTGASLDTIEETVSPGSSSLTYESGTGRYSYIWKTDKTWGGSCRELQLRFADGTTYTARFSMAR